MDNLSNEKSHEKAMAAHERFMARKKAYVMRNPSAVPVREREMILGDIQREGLRKHEMDMLDKRNAGMIAVAKKNAEGLRNQGLGVAEANNTYKKYHGNEHDEKMRKLDHEHALALADKQRQIAIDLETQRGTNAKTLAETQNAGAKNVETIRGDYGVKIAAEQAKGTIAHEQMKNDRKSMDIAARMADRERRETGKDNRERDNRLSKEFTTAIEKSMDRGLSYGAAVAEYKKVHQNDPQKLKDFDRYLDASATSNWAR